MQNEAERFEKGPGRGGVPWSNECRFPSRRPKTPRPRPEGWADEGQTGHGHGAQERERRALPGAAPRPVAPITAAPTCCHAIGTAFPLRRQTGLAVRRPQGPRSCKYSQKTLPAPGLERKSHVAATGATSSHFIRRR